MYAEAGGNLGWGAVLVRDSGERVASRVPPSVASLLQPRKTQIAAFEILAVIGALLLRCRRARDASLVVFCDNTVGLAALSKGTSAPGDLRALVEGLWGWLEARALSLRLVYAPSARNPADAPSRGRAACFGSQTPAALNWTAVLE